MARVKKGTYFKESINRFRLLRYADTDDLSDKPSLTIDDIIEKTGLSKGLVSKLEKQKLKKGDVPPCNASTLKAYHDNLDCSYEYLMGDSETKSIEYFNLGTDPVLGYLPDKFWDNLKYSLTDEWEINDNTVDKERVVILRLLLSNPDAFKTLLDAIFNTLFEIYQIKKAPLPEYLREESISQREYALGQAFNRLLTQNVLPKLTQLYLKYEKDIQKQKKHEDEILASIGQGFLEYMNNKDTDTGE